jgi:plastocyanin
MRLLVACLGAVLLGACASAPPTPAPGRAAAFGYVKLVPREGVPVSGGSHSYGDREFEGVSFVDYSKPGFAVVYADSPVRSGEAAALVIRAGTTHAVFDPPHAALGAGGTIRIANQSGEAHVVSCPGAGLVKPLATGESIEVVAATPGEWPVYLLDVAGEVARVFAAPGPYRVVSSSGRFEFTDLEPGRAQLRAWHPRFPPAETWVDLAAGSSVRVDLELRVGDHDEEPANAK